MNPERISSVNKITGGTPEQQEEIVKKLEKEFSTESWYLNLEREKTQEEKEIIITIINKLNNFLVQYGAKPLNLREFHIHILDKSKMEPDMLQYMEDFLKEGNTSAFHAIREQAIFILDWRIDNLLEFAGTLTHEIIHSISFNSVIVDESSRDGFKEHRVGLFVNSPRIKAEYFKEINEAITEELTERFLLTLKDLPLLVPEYEKLIKAREERSDPYISYVYTKETESEGGSLQEKAKYGYSYEDERKNIRNLIRQIYEKRKEEFSSEEEIFNVFARAAMTGEIEELATLVESALGAGTFKKIANSLNEFGQ